MSCCSPNPCDSSCACDSAVSDDERYAQLDEIIVDQQHRPGALIPVLQMTQAIFGYLPAEALRRIGLGLGKSDSELAGVLSFYSFFSTVPRGRHLVRVCMGTACYVRGGKSILEALRQRLGLMSVRQRRISSFDWRWDVVSVPVGLVQ